jgi:hypothetical protein
VKIGKTAGPNVQPFWRSDQFFYHKKITTQIFIDFFEKKKYRNLNKYPINITLLKYWTIMLITLESVKKTEPLLNECNTPSGHYYKQISLF